MKKLEADDRIEIVRKGYVLHRGRVVARKVDVDSGYGSDVETLQLELDGLGLRSMTREISERGQVSEWRPRAKDMHRLGRFSVRLDETEVNAELDAIEEDAVREMGGDDFVAYEQATGKQIGNK